MKLLIASDIHGSYFYAKKLVEKMNEEGADRLILLGDLLYHGPRNPLPQDYQPAEVASLLNSIKDQIIAVRGNCDSEVDQMVLEFPMRADYTQVMIDGRILFLTHGHIYHPDHLPQLPLGSVFMFGHIHLPIIEKQNGIFILNPGSITLPKQEHPNTYTIYHEGVIQIKTLDGKVYKELRLS
jgi:uncharacterized protein